MKITVDCGNQWTSGYTGFEIIDVQIEKPSHGFYGGVSFALLGFWIVFDFWRKG